MSDYHVERHIVKQTHPDYDELDGLCFLSKNLYNATLYTVRQHYFQTGKRLDYYTVNNQFTHSNQPDYRALPAKVSKQTQRLVDQNFRSFFKLREKGFDANIPSYLHKEKGRQVVHYEQKALSLVKKGWVKLSKTNISIKTKIEKEKIKFVRIVPRGNHIVIEVGYKVQYKANKPKRQRYGSIDIGLNNLATLTSNVCKPIIFNGKPLKSINQFFNKEVSKERSKLDKGEKQNRNRFNRLFLKRKNKITHYLHQVSKQIVNHLVSNDIDTLVIGNNKGWKQDINLSYRRQLASSSANKQITKLGKQNNQNFVSIPFATLISQLKYKCRLFGIEVITHEESYTSKCSFLDNEDVKKHKQYLGKRVKRGLFQTHNGKKINADVNGSLNILKKYLIKKEAWNEKLFSDLVEVSSMPFVQKFTPSF